MKSRIIIVILLFLMALALFGTALVFYYQGEYLPVINRVVTIPIVEKPSSIVIGSMLNNIKSVSTASYELVSKSNWSAYGSPFELNTKIIFDGRFEDKPRGKISISNDIKIQNLTFLASLGMSLAEEKIYFQISEIPALPFIDLQPLQNKWYEADWELTNFDVINNIFESLPNVLQIKERLPDEVINDQLSYHYQVNLNPESFPTFYDPIPQESMAREIFKQENYDQIKMEIWISKNDFYLMKAESNFTNDIFKLQLSLNVSNYNEIISVDKPDEGADLNTMMKDLFKKTNILDITVFSYLVGIDDDYFVEDKDEDKLYLIWENLFGTDDNKSDTDGDGYNDYEELVNGYNPIGSGELLK